MRPSEPELRVKESQAATCSAPVFPPIPSNHRPRRRRLWFFLLLASVLTCAALRIAFLRGTVRPLRVDSGSMAPTLLGPHFLCVCNDCRLTWPFDALQANSLDRLVCPNCGYTNERTVEQLYWKRGDRILVDQWPYRFGAPRRNDMVLFHDSSETPTLAVKRLAGLPGEQISIRDGDLYHAGSIVRKSLKEFRSLAILVHDDRFTPADPELPRRWLPEEDPNWLSFRAWRCYDTPLSRTEETRILDNDGYNQGTSRQLQPVFDLLLTGQADFSQGNLLQIRGHDGNDWFFLSVDAVQHSVTLRRGEVVVARARLSRPRSEWTGRWEFALFDRQIRVSLHGQEVIGYSRDDEPSTTPRQPALHPLAIRQGENHVMLKDRQVYRDIHYLHPHGGTEVWQSPLLGPQEYLVLGDNVPISVDSRRPGNPVHRNQLLGKVLWSWGDGDAPNNRSPRPPH